jgi:hypothetical protein
MTAFPCAGCGRVVVVEHVLCVDCERTLSPAPIVPRLRLDDADRVTTALDDVTLIFDPGA